MPKAKSLVPVIRPTASLIKGGVYVGIDQSMTGTGVVINDDQGNIIGEKLVSTKHGLVPLDEVKRITDLFAITYRFVNEVAAGRPVCALMEDFAFSQVNQMALLGGLGWHFRIMMGQSPWRFGTCPTGCLKKMATGKGNADKVQVMFGVFKRWTFETSDNNIADAFVLSKLCLLAYAQPAPGTLGMRIPDLDAVAKLTIYR